MATKIYYFDEAIRVEIGAAPDGRPRPRYRPAFLALAMRLAPVVLPHHAHGSEWAPAAPGGSGANAVASSRPSAPADVDHGRP